MGRPAARDPMGLLPVWSARGRDLVPHLTEQTTQAAGFQVLLTTLEAWPRFEADHTDLAGQLQDFYLVVEQAFARAAHRVDGDWLLLGARRVRAHDAPSATLTPLHGDRRWHLTSNQLGTGTWGYYRGAAERAGLLAHLDGRLDQDSARAAAGCRLSPRAEGELFRLAAEALRQGAAEMSLHRGGSLVQELAARVREVPLAAHLQDRVLGAGELTRALAERLVEGGPFPDRRTFLAEAARDLVDHAPTLRQVLRCEDVLAPVEATFQLACARRGATVAEVAREVPAVLDQLATALRAFRALGPWRAEVARRRFESLRDQLDLVSSEALLRSVLALHEAVSDERERSPWVRVEGKRIEADVEQAPPPPSAFQPGVAWRNDYYLWPLYTVACQLAERT